jgi:hypothetical protein
VLPLRLAGPLKRVYRKNRQADRGGFLSEYWLGDQAFAFSPEDGNDLFMEGVSDGSALALRASADYRPFECTPFRARPFNLDALKARDIATYASARILSDEVEFGLELTDASGAPKSSRCAGLRLVWHGKSARPDSLVLTAYDKDGNRVSRAEVSSVSGPDPHVLEIKFPIPVTAASLHVLARNPRGADLMIRFAEVLTDGFEYEALLVADDYRLHRHYQVAPAAPADGTGGAEINSGHWRRRAVGETALSEWRVETRPSRADLRPRVMHVPDGYCSAMLWTEHADTTSLDSNLAVVFGRSDIREPSQAVGGFVGAGLPITKTVFYANPTKRPLPQDLGLQASLRDTPGMAELCDTLYQLGWDIGIHSPQPDNSTPEMNAEAIRYVADRYDGRTWIDHSCSVVHNGVSAFGAFEDSEHFIIDYLKETGINYVWEFASEDHAECYIAGLSLLQTRVGDWACTPLSWTLPNLPGLTFWGTTAGTDLGVYTAAELDALIGEWGVAAAHCYPAYHYPKPDGSPFFEPGGDSARWRTTRQFEDILARLVERRDRGDLAVLTVRRWLDYLLAAGQVRIEPHEEGWRLTNPLGKRIKGFSFVVEGACKLDIQPSVVRRTLHGQIMVLDLEPGETVTIRPAGDIAPDA